MIYCKEITKNINTKMINFITGDIKNLIIKNKFKKNINKSEEWQNNQTSISYSLPNLSHLLYISYLLRWHISHMYFIHYYSKNDNVITAYPSMTTKTDTLYTGARTSFIACNTLALIFAFFEIIVLFIGTNMFRHRVNFFSYYFYILDATLHFLGAILWSSYIYQQWQFDQLWAISFVCRLQYFFIF